MTGSARHATGTGELVPRRSGRRSGSRPGRLVWGGRAALLQFLVVLGNMALVDEFTGLYVKTFVTRRTSGGPCSPYDVDLKYVGSKFEFI